MPAAGIGAGQERGLSAPAEIHELGRQIDNLLQIGLFPRGVLQLLGDGCQIGHLMVPCRLVQPPGKGRKSSKISFVESFSQPFDVLPQGHRSLS